MVTQNEQIRKNEQERVTQNEQIRKNEQERIEREQAERVKQEQAEKNVPMIVHRTQYTDGEGKVREKVHGPMPVSEWAAYEKENDL